MNNILFSFYKVLKNEDAFPYVHFDGDSGFLVAADGLGGSGAFVHKLSENEQARIGNDLKYAILPEFFENQEDNDEYRSFKKWFEYITSDIIEPTPHTSALWASRIIIARLAYYLHTNKDIELQNADIREDITEFIYKGLNRVKSEFALGMSEMAGMALLPSTIVAAKYKPNGENVDAEIIWAGDSRAYALIPGEGLKLLSEDDEDASGAITNLFRLKDGKEKDTVLHYSKFRLPAKSILFVCSDGIFDLYDSEIENIGVEMAVLTSLIEASSFEEFSQNWENQYQNTEHDDCTVGYAAFGYESFDEAKAIFAERYAEISRIYNDYYSSKRVIPIIRGQVESPEKSIVDRAYARLEQISELILNEAVKNPETSDPAVTDAVKNYLKSLEKSDKERALEEKQAKENDVCNAIIDSLRTEPESAKQIFCINPKAASSELGIAISRLLEVLKSESSFASEEAAAKAESEKAKRELDEAEDKCNELARKIEARIEDIKNYISSLKATLQDFKTLFPSRIIFDHYCDIKLSNIRFDCKKFTKSLENDISSSRKALCVWREKADNKLSSFNASITIIHEFKKLIQKYFNAKDNCKRCDESLNEIRSKSSESVNNINAALNALDSDLLRKAVTEPENYLSASVRAKYSLPIQLSSTPLTYPQIKAKFMEFLKGSPEVYGSIIEAFISSTKPSVIETFFNKAKLTALKEYKCADISKIKELLILIDAYTVKYTDISSIKA